MEVVFDEIVRRCNGGERVVLCTVVGTRGSTPQAKGAKMLVVAHGRTTGTHGGACVEAEVPKRALGLLSQNTSQLLEFHGGNALGGDDGLICGGVMEIFVQMVGRDGMGPFAEGLGAIRGKIPTIFKIPYEDKGAAKQ